MTKTIAEMKAAAQARADRAAKEAAEKIAALEFIESNGLPVPSNTFSPGALHGCRWWLGFNIKAVDWRQKIADLMRAFTPAHRWRVHDGSLGYPPELAQANDERIDISEIAPFVVRLSRLPGYGTEAEIDWYCETSAGRVRIVVKIVDSDGAGLTLKGIYGPNGRVPERYDAHFPFRTYRVDRFWAASASDPRPTVAYWNASMCWRDDDAAEKWMELTTP